MRIRDGRGESAWSPAYVAVGYRELAHGLRHASVVWYYLNATSDGATIVAPRVLELVLEPGCSARGSEMQADTIYVDAEMTSDRMLAVAVMCALAERRFRGKTFPYTLRVDGFPGVSVGGAPTGSGMSCATFVAHIFEASGNPLVDLTTWDPKPENLAEALAMSETFATHGLTDIAAYIAASADAARLRPSEVAGASGGAAHPVSFLDAQPLSARVCTAYAAFQRDGSLSADVDY